MAETEQIARIAEKVFTEIFSIFRWEEQGSRNQNWECVCQDEHKTGGNTHPSDVVFCYPDSYFDKRIYVNVDLKSYAKDSIKKGKIASSIENLAMSVSCANSSGDWALKYGYSYNNREVIGLLFVYNHDGDYDSSFDEMLGKVKFEDINLSPKRKLYVFGPSTIWYLLNVAHDLSIRFGRGSDQYCFHYPDLVDAHPHAQSQDAASIELLLSPWQIVKCKPGHKGHGSLLCYYSGNGETIDEFKYLIDYLFRYQLMESSEITILMPFASAEAARNLDGAKNAYATDFYKLSEFRNRLDRVKYYSMSTVTKRFSPEAIGMEHREY